MPSKKKSSLKRYLIENPDFEYLSGPYSADSPKDALKLFFSDKNLYGDSRISTYRVFEVGQIVDVEVVPRPADEDLLFNTKAAKR